MKQNRSRQSPSPEPSSAQSSVRGFLNYTSLAIFGAIFIIGILVGITFSSGSNVNPGSINTRIEIDRQVPDAEICQSFGASAIVTDMRVFLTLNPFGVFINQPVMRPGCVLRQSNWSILEQKKAVNSEEIRDCKRRMNTFGFTGSLDSSPKIDCIYQNDAAGNLFNLGSSAPIPETENY